MNKRTILTEMVQNIIDGDTASAKNAFCRYLTIAGKSIINEDGLHWDKEPKDFQYKFSVIGEDGNKYPVMVHARYNMMTAYKMRYASSMNGPEEGIYYSGEASDLNFDELTFNGSVFTVNVDTSGTLIDDTAKYIGELSREMYANMVDSDMQDDEAIEANRGIISENVCNQILQYVVSDIASEQNQQESD